MSEPPLPAPSRRAATREMLSWAMYDWANSAYSTISITLLTAYIQKVVFSPDRFPAEEWGAVGAVVWAWGISFSMVCAALLSPILGAMADARANKHRWLALTIVCGVACGLGLALVPPDQPWTVTVLFVCTTFFFELSLGFYNAFLPEIADESSMNRVSAWGFGLGYIGGGLALGAGLGLVQYGQHIGLAEPADRVRAGLLLMALWWGVFSLPAICFLRDRNPPRNPDGSSWQVARQAFAEVAHTLRHIRALRTLAIFLLGFLFYNEGVQTVISQSSTFAIRDLAFSDSELILLVLMIQFVAFIGALAIGHLADGLQPLGALHLCLALWVGLLVAAWFVTESWEFWILGAFVALVLGGVQSVSRAIMGLLTPRGRTAEFFGFFNFSGKATSFMGTFTFGLIVHLTGSARLAILSLLLFFFVGWAVVSRVDLARGRAEAAAG